MRACLVGLVCAIAMTWGASAQTYVRYVKPSDLATRVVYSDTVLTSITLPWGVAKLDNYPKFNAAAYELTRVLEDPDKELLQVWVCGSASPDGLWQDNVKLAQDRTDAAVRYLRDILNVPANKIHAENLDEDWDRLAELVEASDIEYKWQVLHIIESKSWGERKKALQALDGNVDYSAKMKESERDSILLAVPLEDATKFPEIIAIHRAMTDHQHVKLDTLVASVPKVLIQDKILECNGSDVYSFSERNAIVDQTFDMNIWNKLAQKLMEIWTQYFPLIFLLTSPLLAFAVKLLHLKRKKPFISYFIFALHYTAFIELMLLVIYLLYLTLEPSFDILKWVMILSSGLYLTIAVKNVYEHHSWIKSIWKAFFISLNYLLICLMVFCVIFIVVTFAVIMSEMS